MAGLTALALAAALALGTLVGGMAMAKRDTGIDRRAASGRLTARPLPGGTDSPRFPPGLHPLGLGTERDGLIYIPPGYRADRPAPMVVLLHGAGGYAEHTIPLLRDLADRAGLILLAPESRGPTWDVILDDFGPDVAFIDKALAQTFARYSIDASRIAVGGFSDGASYALSLGLTNGKLFNHVVAFSPGFIAPIRHEGAPRFFISHGLHDGVLPIARCSRRLVPMLEQAGYRVVYREFDGGHTVPPFIAGEAVDWLLGSASPG